MEIPSEIRLDFLFVVLGVILFGLPVYLFFFKESSFDITRLLSLLIFAILGIFFFLGGMFEMILNYRTENELAKLKAKKEKLEYVLDILKLEKKLLTTKSNKQP